MKHAVNTVHRSSAMLPLQGGFDVALWLILRSHSVRAAASKRGKHKAANGSTFTNEQVE